MLLWNKFGFEKRRVLVEEDGDGFCLMRWGGRVMVGLGSVVEGLWRGFRYGLGFFFLWSEF